MTAVRGNMLPRVLIVEDDPIIRELYALKFELEGFPVAAAENGALALEALKNFKPDYILLDMMMPVMDGITFMNHYRRGGHDADVIVFSNVSTPHQRQTVLRLGAVDYWVKSDYTPERVVSTLTQRWQDRAAGGSAAS
jgi:CheY-like chemotaxis protein